MEMNKYYTDKFKTTKTNKKITKAQQNYKRI